MADLSTRRFSRGACRVPRASCQDGERHGLMAVGPEPLCDWSRMCELPVPIGEQSVGSSDWPARGEPRVVGAGQSNSACTPP
ncbi:unnamed protein product, partial [Protopolystoma xenopodis]